MASGRLQGVAATSGAAGLREPPEVGARIPDRVTGNHGLRSPLAALLPFHSCNSEVTGFHMRTNGHGAVQPPDGLHSNSEDARPHAVKEDIYDPEDARAGKVHPSGSLPSRSAHIQGGEMRSRSDAQLSEHWAYRPRQSPNGA